MRPIIQKSYAANKAVVFNGDGYSDEWHAEAERRGLLNLRSTPDALPFLIRDDTITAFSNYGVLSERELHARYEVFLEQYVTKLNIESETAASIARTLLLPAAVRYKAELLTAEEPEMASELGELIASFVEEQGTRGRQPPGEPSGGLRDPDPRQVHARHRVPGDGRRSRGGGQAREGRRR